MAAGKIEERWVTQGAESHAESLLCCCQLLQLSNNDISDRPIRNYVIVSWR